jgi:hypothetical protein
MLPDSPAAAVTPANAERLLLLADKWDMPAVKTAVERFITRAISSYTLPARRARRQLGLKGLPGQLKWLGLASRTGLRGLFELLSDSIAPLHDVRANGRPFTGMDQVEVGAALRGIEELGRADACALLAKLLLR